MLDAALIGRRDLRLLLADIQLLARLAQARPRSAQIRQIRRRTLGLLQQLVGLRGVAGVECRIRLRKQGLRDSAQCRLGARVVRVALEHGLQ